MQAQNQGHEIEGPPPQGARPPHHPAYTAFSREESERMTFAELERRPESRAELLSSLRRAIREGSYRVHGERVAEVMLRRLPPSRLS